MVGFIRDTGKTDKKVKLVMMIGIAGSGKTTYSKELARKENYRRYSSDEIRAEFGYSQNCGANRNQHVFSTLHNVVCSDLGDGYDVIIDATNLSRKARTHLLQRVNKNYNCYTKAVVMATPFAKCLERNATRKGEEMVPEATINRMVNNISIPIYNEGWNEIEIVNTPIEYSDALEIIIDNVHRNYSHGNPNHRLTVGNHMIEAFKLADESVKTAALLHDFGKVFTKKDTNAKGELDGQSHFTNHDSRGAYELMSTYFGKTYTYKGYEINLTLEDLALIQYHMYPYIAFTNETATAKWKRIFGDELFNKIMLLNKADLAAH